MGHLYFGVFLKFLDDLVWVAGELGRKRFLNNISVTCLLLQTDNLTSTPFKRPLDIFTECFTIVLSDSFPLKACDVLKLGLPAFCLCMFQAIQGFTRRVNLGVIFVLGCF